MPTQFDILNQKLDKALQLLNAIAKVAGGWDQLDLDLSDEVPDGHDPGEVISANRVPRTRFVYKSLNGEESFVNANDLDPKVPQVIAIAQAMGESWELYETEDGMIRLATSNEAVAAWNAQHAGPMQ